MCYYYRDKYKNPHDNNLIYCRNPLCLVADKESNKLHLFYETKNGLDADLKFYCHKSI